MSFNAARPAPFRTAMMCDFTDERLGGLMLACTNDTGDD